MANQSIWLTNSRFWPKAPSRFVFLAEAFDEVGRRLFPEAWAGSEALPPATPLADREKRTASLKRAASLPPPPRIVSSYPPVTARTAIEAKPLSVLTKRSPADIEAMRATWEAKLTTENADAHSLLERRDTVAQWIADRGRDGALETFALWVGGGFDPLASPASIWNVANDWSLFADCKIRRSFTAGYPPADYYLFLSRESLTEQLRKLGTKSVVGKISAESSAAQWLREQFADAATTTFPRARFQTEATALYSGLSGEGFKRAWASATADYPERKCAGPKPLAIKSAG